MRQPKFKIGDKVTISDRYINEVWPGRYTRETAPVYTVECLTPISDRDPHFCCQTLQWGNWGHPEAHSFHEDYLQLAIAGINWEDLLCSK